MSSTLRYFSFRTLISGPLIKVMYILGALGITVAGIAMIVIGIVMLFDTVNVRDQPTSLEIQAMMSGPVLSLVGGLVAITFGNVFWRISCEGWILFFSMHEMLASLERELRLQRPREQSFWDKDAAQ